MPMPEIDRAMAAWGGWTAGVLPWREAGAALVAVLLLVVFVLIWNMQLRRRVAQATRELSEQNRLLAAAQQGLANIVESLPDATFAIDSDRRVIAWNSAIEAMTGVPKERILGKGEGAYAVAFYGEARPILIDHAFAPELEIGPPYSRVQREGASVSAEVYAARVHGGKGGHLWCKATVLRDASGRVIGAIESVRDIGEIKRAEGRLREVTRLLRGVVQASPLPIVSLDREKNVRMWNPAAERLFGYREDEVIGAQYPLMTEEERPAADRHFEALWRGEERQEYRGRRRCRDGRLIDVRIRTALLRDEGGGEPLGVLIILEDIAQELRAEAQREQMNRLALTGQLAAGVAHEIRNPLHAILQFLELLRPRLPDAKSREWSEMMEEGLRRIERLSARLMRLGQGSEAQRAPCDLARLVAEAVELVGSRARKEGISIDVRLQPDLPLLNGYGDRLTEALLNLLLNALDACDKGDRIEVEASGAGDEIRISVMDTGPGVPAELRERIFEPFFTTKAIGKGAGLGLALVRRTAMDHGGTVELAPATGRGARFVLRLPVTGAGGGAMNVGTGARSS